MIPKIIILVGLTRLLAVTNKPYLCSGIYTGLAAFIALLSHGEINIVKIIIGVAITFIFASIYFALLDRFSSNLPLYFGILIGGLVIGLI